MSCGHSIVLPRKEKKVTELILVEKLRSYNHTSGYSRTMRKAADTITEQQEAIRELVEALRPFESKIQAMDYATDQHYDKAAELVKRHGEK